MKFLREMQVSGTTNNSFSFFFFFFNKNNIYLFFSASIVLLWIFNFFSFSSVCKLFCSESRRFLFTANHRSVSLQLLILVSVPRSLFSYSLNYSWIYVHTLVKL